ncbi:MAG: peptidylprolyl isomerase [Candidatus Hydrothermales bacterium]
MIRIFLIIFIFLSLLNCKRAEEKKAVGTPIAKVGNVYITQEDLERGLPQFAYQLMGEEQRREFLQYVIDLVIFSLAAEREGIDKEDVIKERLTWARRLVLSDEYFRRKTQNIMVTQSVIDSFYKAHENDFLKEIEFVYFFVNTLKDAQDIREILRKTPFSPKLVEEIITKYNAIGDVTSINSGYLHLEMLPTFPREIAKALLNLPIGYVSEVISVQNPPGFAVVKILSSSPTKLVKRDILNEIGQYLHLTKVMKAKDSIREELKKIFPVEIYTKVGKK